MTCGVSVNHLTLNENDIGSYRTFLRLKPPLRGEDDRRAMVRGLAAGEIDVIVSSHDPQDVDVKRHPFAEAADGAIGLETLLAAALRLYHNGEIGLMPLLRAMTINPARLLGLPSGRLEKGAPADLILVDLGQPWVVDKALLKVPLQELALRREQDAGARAHHHGCRQDGLSIRCRRARVRAPPSLERLRWAFCSQPTLRWRCLSAISWAPSPSACC